MTVEDLLELVQPWLEKHPNGAVLVELVDGTVHAIAGVNALGGVCDDCRTDIMKSTVDRHEQFDLKFTRPWLP